MESLQRIEDFEEIGKRFGFKSRVFLHKT